MPEAAYVEVPLSNAGLLVSLKGQHVAIPGSLEKENMELLCPWIQQGYNGIWVLQSWLSLGYGCWEQTGGWTERVNVLAVYIVTKCNVTFYLP